MPDSISRLQLVRDEIDKAFGAGFAEKHPELVIATMNAASSDWAASRLAVAIERVAAALLLDDESSHSIVRAHELQRMRP